MTKINFNVTLLKCLGTCTETCYLIKFKLSFFLILIIDSHWVTKNDFNVPPLLVWIVAFIGTKLENEHY